MLFAVVGVLSFSPLLLLLALFVYDAASSESRTVALTALLEGLTVDDVASPLEATVEADTVADLMETDLPRFVSNTAAFDALVELDTARATAAFVDGPEGTRVVSRDDFASAMETRRLVGSPEPF